MRKFCFLIVVLFNSIGAFAQVEVCTEESYLNEDLNSIDKCAIEKHVVKNHEHNKQVFDDSVLKIKQKDVKNTEVHSINNEKVSKELIDVLLERKSEELLKEDN
ncbi:MAG: hypothetical protein ACPGU6_07185 [Tenacibaculum sp.]